MARETLELERIKVHWKEGDIFEIQNENRLFSPHYGLVTEKCDSIIIRNTGRGGYNIVTRETIPINAVILVNSKPHFHHIDLKVFLRMATKALGNQKSIEI
jgi:hypothetical protein